MYQFSFLLWSIMLKGKSCAYLPPTYCPNSLFIFSWICNLSDFWGVYIYIFSRRTLFMSFYTHSVFHPAKVSNSGRIQYISVLIMAVLNKYFANPNFKELSLCFSTGSSVVAGVSFKSVIHSSYFLYMVCHGLSVCVPTQPKFKCWNPNVQYDSIKSWGLEKWLGQREGKRHHRIP